MPTAVLPITRMTRNRPASTSPTDASNPGSGTPPFYSASGYSGSRCGSSFDPVGAPADSSPGAVATQLELEADAGGGQPAQQIGRHSERGLAGGGRKRDRQLAAALRLRLDRGDAPLELSRR